MTLFILSGNTQEHKKSLFGGILNIEGSLFAVSEIINKK
jgi:hypothetical protein